MPSGFFALFDDIAILMDDVAVMSKVATRKTAGILVDDLAVNAEKASGFVSARELPILWKIGKGSLLSKLIILPFAFLLSAYLPWVIVPILLLGGIYLAYEGVEKIYEFLFHRNITKRKVELKEMTPAEQVAYENQKVKDAITVDFILSIEIVIIALGSVSDQPLRTQIPVVTIVALLATVGVYGLVALLVRMDDTGYKLIARAKREDGFLSRLGKTMVNTLPVIVRALGIIGTIAMILVAGGIFVHNLHFFHDLFPSLPSILVELVMGLLIGAVAVFTVKMILKIVGVKKHA